MSDQTILSEKQNINFDQEFFAKPEFDWLIGQLQRRFNKPLRLLDVGGGNGKFLDAMMSVLSTRDVVNIDLSAALLERNVKNKRLVCG